jgi:hypothetical protein
MLEEGKRDRPADRSIEGIEWVALGDRDLGREPLLGRSHVRGEHLRRNTAPPPPLADTDREQLARPGFSDP